MEAIYFGLPPSSVHRMAGMMLIINFCELCQVRPMHLPRKSSNGDRATLVTMDFSVFIPSYFFDPGPFLVQVP